jgi:hypothetical protein
VAAVKRSAARLARLRLRLRGHPAAAPSLPGPREGSIELARRRNQLAARLAEQQWDLGGLAYEMASRDSIRVDVLVRRAAELQATDAELGEVERILRLEQTGAADACGACRAPHSAGAVYCWQCGHPLIRQVAGDAIAAA